MGTLYINGKPLSVENEEVSMTISWCDQCEKWRNVAGGRMIHLSGETDEVMGEAVLWICRECHHGVSPRD